VKEASSALRGAALSLGGEQAQSRDANVLLFEIDREIVGASALRAAMEPDLTQLITLMLHKENARLSSARAATTGTLRGGAHSDHALCNRQRLQAHGNPHRPCRPQGIAACTALRLCTRGQRRPRPRGLGDVFALSRWCLALDARRAQRWQARGPSADLAPRLRRCRDHVGMQQSSSLTPPAGHGAEARRRFDSPITDWQPWLGPVGLVLALVVAVFAGLIIALPLSALDVHATGAKPSGGVLILDTALQDMIFVATAVVLAGTGARKVHSWQFGLRGTPWRRAAGFVALAFVAFIVFAAIWSTLIHSETDKVLEKLGSKEGSELLIASALLTCVIAPICEELLFRGFIFTSLRNWKGPWVGAVLTALIFGAVHATSAPAEDLLPLAGLGFVLCLLYRATGSIYPCIALHAINNCLAFGEIEEWGWQIAVLLVGSFACIWLLVLAAKRIGLIGPGGPPAQVA
jgi:membrane protease YdiL (CAAX protease family)